MTAVDAPDRGGPFGWWSRIGPVKRVVTVVVVLAVGVNVALAALDSVVGSDPGGPTGSSYATGDDGVAAWSDLLQVRGIEVEALRRPVGEADLPAGGTVVLVEPADGPTPEGVGALAEHLAAGGRVVAVGERAMAYTDALAGHPDLVAVADPTPLQNAHLAEGDNAALAVRLAGPGPVAFAEAEHGYGAAQGLDAVPGRWKATVIGLVLAVLVGSWSFGQRLGPAEALDRPLPPPRRAYVDALAAGLARRAGPPPPHPPPPGGDP